MRWQPGSNYLCPRFKDISYLRDKNIVRLKINIDHKQDYHEWEDKLN